MDLASAVQSLLAYEASLKLAPGHKPPPPSPSLFAQLSDAVDAIETAMRTKEPLLRFFYLPPSVWSDWPLCCGVNLTPKELQAARSLRPSLLPERGLLGLVLALHSCAEGSVDRAASLASDILATVAVLPGPKEDDPAPFPSAHLAARVGHRLINADDTLDLQVSLDGNGLSDRLITVLRDILSRARARSERCMPAVPHEAAGLSLVKETAAILDALCAAQLGSEGGGCMHGRSLPNLPNRLHIFLSCQLLKSLMSVLNKADRQRTVPSHTKAVFSEAAALPVYNPVLLLQSAFVRNIDIGRQSLSSDSWHDILSSCRALLWTPLHYPCAISKLRPVDGYAAIRIGLVQLRKWPEESDWSSDIIRFAILALQSGLVRPELILRARPQLLEGLVEDLARGLLSKDESRMCIPLLVLLTQSSAVCFHLTRFCKQTGCLQPVRAISDPDDCRIDLIRLLGPRANQSVAEPFFTVKLTLLAIKTAREEMRDSEVDMGETLPIIICDSIIHVLTVDTLRSRKPRDATLILRYLSELSDELTASKRPHAQYGALMVVGVGKACLALSRTVTRALQDIDIRGASPKGEPVVGPRDSSSDREWRRQLVEMGGELSVLRRRLLHELLPLAEARDAALWEGVVEEEVLAALRGAPDTARRTTADNS